MRAGGYSLQRRALQKQQDTELGSADPRGVLQHGLENRLQLAGGGEMLIRRIAGGDQLAMRSLFARHQTPLYRWLLRIVRNDTLAEDLLSEVFLDVWQKAGTFEARSP